MYRIDFNSPKPVHFVGIGGISMSGLAKILLKKGFKITGSDMTISPICKELEKEGAVIYYNHSVSNISKNIS